jgi:hypothetical protein
MTIPDENSALRAYRTPVEKRRLARKLRAIVRSGNSVTSAAERHKISRAYYYVLIEELEAWDDEVTREEQIAELDADLDAKLPGATFATFCANKWFLAGGQLKLDYIRGVYDPNVDISVSRPKAKRDPLLD